MSRKATRQRPTLEALEVRALLSFSPPVNYAAGQNAWAVAADELGGEGVGREDLAVANYGDDSVSVLIGKGDGSFHPAVNYPAGPGPVFVATGDFNGDAVNDIAVANVEDHRVRILLNKGDGTFLPAIPYRAGPEPRGLAIGDFDSDGAADIAVASSAGKYVGILFNNGDGTFQRPVRNKVPGFVSAVATADMNTDGSLDLAATNFDASLGVHVVSILLNKGDGVFHQAVDYGTQSAPRFAATGDFDHDNDIDLAVTCSFWPALDFVDVLLNNGNGTFQTAVTYDAGPVVSTAAIADYNHDGHLDVAIGNVQTNEIRVLFGTGDGAFQPAVSFAIGGDSWTIATGDFNADGYADLAAAHYFSNSVGVALNDGAWFDPLPDSPMRQIQRVAVSR